MALSGRAPGPGGAGDDPCTGHGIAVLVAADRRLNSPAAGRGKAPAAGQRVQFNEASLA